MADTQTIAQIREVVNDWILDNRENLESKTIGSPGRTIIRAMVEELCLEIPITLHGREYNINLLTSINLAE